MAASLPVLAALGKDAGEEGLAGFKGGSGILPLFARTKRRDAASTLEFGFSGDEAAFAGGFEDGGAVAFEVGLHPPQRRHPRLQPRELLLNLRHNPPLFVNRRGNGNEQLPKTLVRQVQAAVAATRFHFVDGLARVRFGETLRCNAHRVLRD